MAIDLNYKDITERIIGASCEVYKFLGNACLPNGSAARRQEVIYQRALAWELEKSGLSYAREIEQEIFYKELKEPIGTRRADFVVEEKVLVELKAYRLGVALLINFGGKSLTFKRLVL